MPVASPALTLPSPLRQAQGGAKGRGFFGDDCRACSEHPLAMTRTRAAFRYEGDVRRIVHAFKFGGQSALAASLGEVLTGVWEEHGFDVDAIVPVPLTAMRRRTRGFNQALLLAREVSRASSVAVDEVLRRRRGGPPQAGSASAVERRRNVEGAFEAGRLVAGKRLLLIDDVITTGATLDACARALIDAGASEVSALTLARED